MKPLRPGAYIQLPKEIPKHNYVSFRAWDVLPGSWECKIHNNCICNEQLALNNRVCQAVADFDPKLYPQARKCARAIARWLGKTSKSDGSWIENYSGRKLTRYRNAKAQYELEGIGRRRAILSSFIKLEKISDASRDPRVIQARSPVFNYALGNFLKPMEHKLYKLTGSKKLAKWFPKGRLIAKNLTLDQRAQIIKRKFDRFQQCVVYSIDCSRFDAHVNKYQLALEHLIYKTSNNDPELNSLLDMQYKNVGYTKRGIKYCCPAGRMSGDMNTALGNCLIMAIMIGTATKICKISPNKFDCFIDGDDTLLFIDKSQENLLTQFVEILTRFGHEVKLENRSEVLENVIHCQAQPVKLATGYRMVQTPTRHLSRYLVSVKNFPKSHSKCLEYLRQLGLCSLACHDGVPIFHALANKLIQSGTSSDKLKMSGKLYQASREINSEREFNLDIHFDTRISFWMAFGISPEDQILYEQYIQALDYSSK